MKHPPYHLRTNKAVDRLLLVDLLRPLNPDNRFTYYSLAGPFLEDLRVLDHFFPELPLVSLEIDEETYKRQQFHKFNSRIDLRMRSFNDFLDRDYEPEHADIFWLDYTDLKYERFEEFQVLLTQVLPGSIVRITLRAKPEVDLESLEEHLPEDAVEHLQQELQNDFEEIFAKVLPLTDRNAFGRPRDFARMVQNMVQLSATAALNTPGSNRKFMPIQSTRYNDNTQMVSITGIVHLDGEREVLQERFSRVRFADFAWSEPIEINIPALSLKECLKLESHLPVPVGQDVGEVLLAALDYYIDNRRSTSKRRLSQYADHHREYPQFVRLSV